ncbi:hypothetical protein LCGC14_2032740 [marine sediment metagenome]|uniref:Uncharacterized protein n=1 Tax=marine sediment metagenome TaxID=412755 RepID=A0A0F9HR53_9ZZZZ
MPEIDDDALALLQEAALKTDDGQRYPSAAYAYVPDAEKPSTWKLRLWETLEKKVTVRQLGVRQQPSRTVVSEASAYRFPAAMSPRSRHALGQHIVGWVWRARTSP